MFGLRNQMPQERFQQDTSQLSDSNILVIWAFELEHEI